jgi:GABA(A) receptor-associated protein
MNIISKNTRIQKSLKKKMLGGQTKKKKKKSRKLIDDNKKEILYTTAALGTIAAIAYSAFKKSRNVKEEPDKVPDVENVPDEVSNESVVSDAAPVDDHIHQSGMAEPKKAEAEKPTAHEIPGKPSLKKPAKPQRKTPWKKTAKPEEKTKKEVVFSEAALKAQAAANEATFKPGSDGHQLARDTTPAPALTSALNANAATFKPGIYGHQLARDTAASTSSEVRFEFKEKSSLKDRLQKSAKLMKKNPDQIPIIVEKFHNCKDKIDIKPKKFLVAKNPPFLNFLYSLKEDNLVGELPSDKDLVLYNYDKLLDTNEPIGNIYNKYKDDDGFLYLIFSTKSKSIPNWADRSEEEEEELPPLIYRDRKP